MHSKLIASAALLGLMMTTSVFAQEAAVPKQTVNDTLRARLPEKIRTDGKTISINNGSFPPYEIVTGTELTGASADLTDAIGQMLGVKIEHETVSGLTALLAGINSGGTVTLTGRRAKCGIWRHDPTCP
ncbi:ABC-type amino acid transport substrate-binding protein [Rhizobium leguminosarum]|nr:ABC-type amino acid transport substrate-binding protein [Rhizobium leguminosarum]